MHAFYIQITQKEESKELLFAIVQFNNNNNWVIVHLWYTLLVACDFAKLVHCKKNGKDTTVVIFQDIIQHYNPKTQCVI